MPALSVFSPENLPGFRDAPKSLRGSVESDPSMKEYMNKVIKDTVKGPYSGGGALAQQASYGDNSDEEVEA